MKSKKPTTVLVIKAPKRRMATREAKNRVILTDQGI